MHAGDQWDRQQFHEAKEFNASEATVLVRLIATAFRNTLVEDIEIGASREMPQAAADHDRTAAVLLRFFNFLHDGIDQLRTQQIVGPVNHGQY